MVRVFGLDMALHVLAQFERALTEGTVVVALVRVRHQVSLQLPRLGEAHAAHGAHQAHTRLLPPAGTASLQQQRQGQRREQAVPTTTTTTSGTTITTITPATAEVLKQTTGAGSFGVLVRVSSGFSAIHAKEGQ